MQTPTTHPAPPPPLRPSAALAWWLALRPKTLSAGFVPVWVGTALTAGMPPAHPARALMATCCALLIQVGTNLYNDYADFCRGADTAERLGPRRATQQGWLRPKQVLWGACLAFGLALVGGLYLIYCGGWPILLIGAVSLLMGFAYTGGPYPLAYHGLGELFVFVFFGLVAVGGSSYLQDLQAPTPVVWMMGGSIGLLACAVLVVNNLRDIPTDAQSAKKTLAVRLGAPATRWLYAGLLLGAYVLPLIAICRGCGHGLGWAFLSLPWALLALRQIRVAQGAQLNGLLAHTAQLQLIFGALLVAGATR
jgi:1,4-dihydroxy-2-naphthoate octaprenyltransferase